LKFRKSKKDDQENIEKAYNILVATVENHPEIETTLWAGALMSAFVHMHLNTKMPYKIFCDSLDNIKNVYKNWFDEDEKLEN
jgi:hypothetical protein